MDVERTEEWEAGRAPKRAMPNANVPEHVVICLDLCQPRNSSPFLFERLNSSREPLPSLLMLKKIIQFFMYNKQAINADSQFALIVLRSTGPLWIQNFTKNVNDIVEILENFHSDECEDADFDLSSLFNLVHKHINLPLVCADYKIIPPPNVVRLLLIYNRSECIPKFIENNEVYSLLMKHPYFTTDVLYAHEENCGDLKCKDIYDNLQVLDNGYSYIFEVSKSAEKIHEYSAKLLAHPLQRPQQYDARYKFIE